MLQLRHFQGVSGRTAIPQSCSPMMQALRQVTDEGQETEGLAEATPDASEQHSEPDADVDDLVDAAKAQELRLEGNEHFKAGRHKRLKPDQTYSNIFKCTSCTPFSRG